jgi:hypothetical protein
MSKSEFTLYTAACRGNQNNTSYPEAMRVTDIESLKQAVNLDHVSALYRTGYKDRDTEHKNPIPFHRSLNDFDRADGIMFDVDNTPPKKTSADIPPEKLIYPSHIKAAFPGVPFYVVYSRNHMKPKGE